MDPWLIDSLADAGLSLFAQALIDVRITTLDALLTMQGSFMAEVVEDAHALALVAKLRGGADPANAGNDAAKDARWPSAGEGAAQARLLLLKARARYRRRDEKQAEDDKKKREETALPAGGKPYPHEKVQAEMEAWAATAKIDVQATEAMDIAQWSSVRRGMLAGQFMHVPLGDMKFQSRVVQASMKAVGRIGGSDGTGYSLVPDDAMAYAQTEEPQRLAQVLMLARHRSCAYASAGHFDAASRRLAAAKPLLQVPESRRFV